MKNKYKKLLKNTSIFALGTFGTKILSFLMVPLYTFVLSTSDYGQVDLLTSTISLIIPFSTLLIYEAAIRFLIGKELEKSQIFNNCFLVFIVGTVFSFLVSPLLLFFLNLTQYYIYFVLLLFFTTFSTIFGQFLRACGDNWGFSLSGIINSFFLVIFNLIFLLVLKIGLLGYLLSLIISQFITCVFIIFRCHFFSYLNSKFIDFLSLKKMLIFSIPLVPNNIMWWIMNAGDKYVINVFLGNSANGLFSIAYKIPTIITMLFSIFMQAWQVSAIEEKSDDLRNTFYKNVFVYISLLLVICASFIILFINPLFEYLIGNSFKAAWYYVPFLSVATLFNCFSTFAGVVYIVNKNSKRSFFTTFIGAFLNILFNFLFIMKYGLLGVSIGTIVGYLIVMIIRLIDFKKVFNISLIDRRFICLLLIIVFDSIIYTFTNGYFKYSFSILCIFLIFALNKNDIMTIITKINRFLISKKVK